MSFLDTFFGGGGQAAANDLAGGYDNAKQELMKYLEQIKQQYAPWINQGQRAAGNMMNMGDSLKNQFLSMMNGGGYSSAYNNQQPHMLNSAVPGNIPSPAQAGQSSSNGMPQPQGGMPSPMQAGSPAPHMLGPGGTQQQSGSPTQMQLSVPGQNGGGNGGSWMSNYQLSPMAKYQMDQAMNVGNNAAAASGAVGSTGAIRNNMQMGQNIASQDMQNYYNDMMGLNKAANESYSPLANFGNMDANQLAEYLFGTGQGMADADTQQGAARAAGDRSRAGAWQNAAGIANKILFG